LALSHDFESSNGETTQQFHNRQDGFRWLNGPPPPGCMERDLKATAATGAMPARQNWKRN